MPNPVRIKQLRASKLLHKHRPISELAQFRHKTGPGMAGLLACKVSYCKDASTESNLHVPVQWHLNSMR